MPPKVKINRQAIIEAATDLVRTQGHEQLNARSLAAQLHCSTQPIFSNFENMEEVKMAVVDAAQALYESYMEEDTKSGLYPPYKASGMAYIRFALEEKELFKLLFMRDRTAEEIPEETEFGKAVMAMVEETVGLDSPAAQLFHLEMWAFVHGIAAMVATNYLALDMKLVSRMTSDTYNGLLWRFEKEYGQKSEETE